MTSRSFQSLLIATANRGKVAELGELLRPLDCGLTTLADFPDIVAPEESGETFADNAAIKAVYYAQNSASWAIADDSGLEIDLLGGAPGVYSSRFGGPDSSYREKMDLILSKMADAEDHERTARFVCVIKAADPDGNVVITAEGICDGTIARRARGANGFGYDPIFMPLGFDRTFGELTDDKKRAISHRGKASEELIRKMLDFTGV